MKVEFVTLPNHSLFGMLIMELKGKLKINAFN
jgi:hypothetical protein